MRSCNIISRFFKTFHKAGAILRNYIKEYNIEGGNLRTYVPTRWISIYETVDAVCRLRRPLETV